MKNLLCVLICQIALGTVSGQNVGINNTNPQVSLDVTGAIRHREQTVDPFNNNVNLPPNCSFLTVNPNVTNAAVTITDPNDYYFGQRLVIFNAGGDNDVILQGEVIGPNKIKEFINRGGWLALTPTNSNPGNYGTVVNPVTGKIWLDRNQGATQVAGSFSDAAAFGDLYQWGRSADGHEKRNSLTTTTLATNWLSGGGPSWNGRFIVTGDIIPNNWLTTAETHMWSGTAAENNPCPSGYRIPTNAEWNQERLTWQTNNAAGAFNSVLRLPLAGLRSNLDGLVESTGIFGYYWSSTVQISNSLTLFLSSSSAGVTPLERSTGYSVRCIKD